MIKFDTRYFVKFDFRDAGAELILKNAIKDLKIAKEYGRPEVRFNYSYSALIKAGMALLAKVGSVKVKSIPGHHIKIIEKTAEILKDKSVETVGNAMRSKRNEDFYGTGIFISEKESADYYNFTKNVLSKVEKFFR